MTSSVTMTANEIASSTTATAAAPSRLSFSMLPRMRTEVTSVRIGRFPESSTSEPYSLTPRANDSAAPAAMAGARLGRMMRRKMTSRLAPSDAAAASASRSSSASTGCTVRTMNGSVTNRNARNTAIRVLAMFTPSGLSGPYNDSSTRPATIVGSANGMSINTSSTRCPTNRSRTRTHAMSVPMTTFTRVTRVAVPTVRRIAAAVCSEVTDCQKLLHPPSPAVTTTAVSGMSTSRLNHSIATPRPMAGPRVNGRPPRSDRRARVGRAGVRVADVTAISRTLR
jgi:hypothetical protein